MEEQVKYNAPRRQKAPPPGTRVVFERRVAEQVHDAPVVPILAVPVPHMVDQLEVLKILGIQLPVLPEQVIEVPTISTPSRCCRTVLSAPQMAKQLVEVLCLAPSSWCWSKSSRFSPRTEFNSVGYRWTAFCGAER